MAAILLAACSGSGAVPSASVSRHTPGALDDTWIGQGVSWRQIAGLRPPARYDASLAYDATRRVYLLFGGQRGSVSYSDTWAFDGTRWKQLSPAHRPDPRRDAAMAYDPQRKVVVLYGGLVADALEGHEVDETWTWDGVDWTEVNPTKGGPGPRDGARMATTDNGVLLFGGYIGNETYFGDAWTWDGQQWARADRGPGPAGRGDSAIAWNRSVSSLFVSGGSGQRPNSGPGNRGLPLSDAWSLKDGAWSQLASQGPPATSDANALWDPTARKVVVVFGLVCPNPVGDAWAWDGSTWQRSTLRVPPRSGAAVAEDSNGQALVFGGDDEVGC